MGLTAVLWLLAFAPFPLVFPPFIALVPYVLFLERAARQRPSLRDLAAGGAAFGFASSLLLFHWVPVALWLFTPWALGLSLGLMGGVAAGWIGVALATVFIRRRLPRVPHWLVFAICWTAWESLQALLGPLAFPWLGLAAGVSRTPVLLQGADLVGGLGLTWWLAGVNAALAAFWTERTARAWPALAVAGSMAVALAYGWTRLARVPVEPAGLVMVVQPNVPASVDWYAAGDSLVEALDRQTRAAIAERSADLILWPEVAVPGVLADESSWQARIGGLVEDAGVPLLFGTLERPSPERVFNAAVLWPVDQGPTDLTRYRKRRLVPVTERALLGVSVSAPGRGRAARFAAGGAARPMASPLGPLGLTICFESIFPDLARAYRREGAAVLVNLTNDVWMGPTAGPWQHAAHLRLRAVENRLGVVQAANSGVSEVLDPLGRVVGALPVSEAGAATFPVYTSPTVPPAVRLGQWFGGACLAFALSLLVIAVTRSPLSSTSSSRPAQATTR